MHEPLVLWFSGSGSGSLVLVLALAVSTYIGSGSGSLTLALYVIEDVCTNNASFVALSPSAQQAAIARFKAIAEPLDGPYIAKAKRHGDDYVRVNMRSLRSVFRCTDYRYKTYVCGLLVDELVVVNQESF